MDRMKECREKAGYSQKFVAITVGVSPPQVCKWEAGVTQPSRKNLQALADLYGVSVDYLLGRDGLSEDSLVLSNAERILILKIRTNPQLHRMVTEMASLFEVKAERNAKKA